MRIILASLAVAFAVGLIGPGVAPASAHYCATPVEVKVGKKATVNIGVAAEDKPITSIDITIPAGFDLIDPVGYLGWVGSASADKRSVHFQNSTMQPYTCTFFSLDGTATSRGRLVLPILTHAQDGTTLLYKSTQPFNPYAAQLIYAGVRIPNPTVTPGGKSSSSIAVAIVIAIALGALAVGAMVLANRRRGA